jgi:putative FmdB family regulatory protein
MIWKALDFFSAYFFQQNHHMPNYDYLCEKCGKTFEAFQSMKDKAFDICPKELCTMKKWGRGKVKRQLGAGAGLIFKGSGFYITDYRSTGYKEAAKKDTAPATGEAKKPVAPAEKSKPTKAKE